MKSIKKMLLGISFLLIVIIIHLFIQEALISDFISIIGMIVIIQGYCNSGD